MPGSVVVDANAADGTILSNQAFVTSVPAGVVDHPSDDPDTQIPDDPTRDIVGALPLLFAAKDVVLIDNGTTPGIVEPGDTLRYTITLTNSGAVPATDAVLQDAVPAMRRKGRVQPGTDADLVVFDEAGVTDQAIYVASTRPSSGIAHVMVGGTFVVRDRELVPDALPGRPVRALPR